VPAIVVFHGDGQDAATIARRWGLEPGSPIPANVADYLLVFPEADPRLSGEWVHFQKADGVFPTLDLEFVDLLVQELTTRLYPTGSALVPDVSADPALIYAAGFSSGAGMVWQLLNSDRVGQFRGFAAVGLALDPEKAERYRRQLAASGDQPPPVPVAYVHGTGEHTFRAPATLLEVPIDTTRPRPQRHLADDAGCHDRADSGKREPHRGRRPALPRHRSVLLRHGDQRRTQLARTNHRREPTGGITLRCHRIDHRVLARPRRPAVTPNTRSATAASEQFRLA
jgi:hypothetical protein